MSDLLNGLSLESFVALACPGGFSYGDVLGAGAGWAKSAFLHEGAKLQFKFLREKILSPLEYATDAKCFLSLPLFLNPL